MFRYFLFLHLLALVGHYGVFLCYIAHCTAKANPHLSDWLNCGFHLLIFLAHFFLFVLLAMHRKDPHGPSEGEPGE